MKVKSRAKKFFAILMSVAMVVSMMPAMAFAEPPSGQGTLAQDSDGTYLISSEQDLVDFRTMVNSSSNANDFDGKTVKLCADIPLTDTYYSNSSDLKEGIVWQIGGSGSNPFKGTFDGNGKTISGLKTSLFGNLEGEACVKDLTVKGSDADGYSFDGIAAIARIVRENSTVVLSNCKSELSIYLPNTTVTSDQTQAGGLVALVGNENGDSCLVLEDCSVTGNITINNSSQDKYCNTGGLVGNVKPNTTLVFKGNNSFTGDLIFEKNGKTDLNKPCNVGLNDKYVGNFSKSNNAGKSDAKFKWAVTLHDYDGAEYDVYASNGTELKTLVDAYKSDVKYWTVKDSSSKYSEFEFTEDNLTKSLDLYAFYEDQAKVSNISIDVKQNGAELTDSKADEGSVITLSADVKDADNNDIETGTVTFYADGVAVGTVLVGNSFEYTLPLLNGSDKSVTIKAMYSGTDKYSGSVSDEKTVSLNSVYIKNGGVSLTSEPVLTAGKESTLKITGVVKNSKGETLTENTDYTVEFYQNTGTGVWIKVEGNKVTPANDNYAYMARVIPAGTYKEGAFETDPIGNGDIKKIDTGVTVALAKTGDVYQNKPTAFKATVKADNSNVAGGTVSFYYAKAFGSNNSYVFAATVPVVNGEAAANITFPEGAVNYIVKAVYSGNDVYNGSEGFLEKVAVKSTTLSPEKVELTVSGEEASKIKVGEENVLNLSVSGKANSQITYTLGTDYIIVWQANDGNGWVEFDRTVSGTDMTTKITPDSNKWSYRALILPIGDYNAPTNGIVSNAVSATEKVATATTLTASDSQPFEESSITLKAAVKYGEQPASGTVQFYQGDTYLGDALIDSVGYASLIVTVPEYTKAAAANVTYTAKYLENNTYSASEGSVDVTVIPAQIRTDKGSKEITVKPAANPSGSLTVGEEYTLTIPAVFSRGTEKQRLTVGTDYIVQWYVSTDGGNLWNVLGNSGDSIIVKPTDKNSTYKADIKPIGNYKKAWDGEKVVDYLTMSSVTSQVAQTTTTLTVKDTAEPEDTNLTEYEGEKVTLEATVKELTKDGTEGNIVSSGYVYFYKDSEKINNVAAEVVNGVATLEAVMSSYDTVKNKDVFTAKYVENSSYDASTANNVAVLIRSTKIAVPVIEAAYNETSKNTAEDEINGLPAGTPIAFSLTGNVKALDGRELKAGTDYTFQWEQNSNKGMFVEIQGAVKNKYSIDNGKDKDSFRLTLKPIGHMAVGSTSKTATIGNLADPKVSINVTSPYTTIDGSDTYSGSHYGDEVTLTATVKGDSALPTGVVSFWYSNEDSTSIQIGDYVELEKSTTPGETNTAKAKISTTALPEGAIDIYVKYHGDSTFEAEESFTTYNDHGLDYEAVKEFYLVWSTEIANDRNVADGHYLDISVTGKNGTSVTGGIGTLDAGSTYEITLTSDVYTTGGQLLEDDEFVIEWQQSENGVDWVKVPGSANKKSCTVKPENENMQYRAQVTTTYELFAPPLETVPTRLDTECSNVIGCDPQAVEINVTTDKTSAAAPYTDAVYEGNEITLYAEVIPTDPQHTKAVGGKVEFYYAVYNETDNTCLDEIVAIPSSDPKDGGSNQANVVERDGKYYAAITTTALPANSEAKMQKVVIVANYLGDGTYEALKRKNVIEKPDSNDRIVTVYSSTLYSDAAIQNKIIDDPSSAPPAVTIYAPEDILVADGSPTVLTLKNLYTLDAEDGYKTTPITVPGEYTYLTESTNYTVQWQYTTALNESKPEDSSWLKLDAVGHQATVSPQAGYAYRAVVTVDQTAERTVKSQKTYYSNVLAATSADAVLQVRAIPTSSGGFKDTNLVFDAYVSGGTTVPVGDITLKLVGTLGGTLERSATAVNGQVKFGAGIGDTKGVINLPADVYKMTASYEGNNGYKIETNEQTYIVRYKANEVAVKVNESDYAGLVYDGTIQRPDSATVTFNGGTGHTAAQKKADASVVYNYEMKKGNDWVAVDAPFDAGEYRVTAVLPESIYYEAQQSNPYTFEIAQKPISISDILVQAKIYDGTKNANILDVQLDGVVAGDSVYTKGGAATASEKALVTNTVTYTATGLLGPDAGNYKFAANGDSISEAFTIARNLVTVDSSAIAKTNLEGLKVYDNYGTDMAKGTDYTVRYFYHDGSGVKETSNLNKVGKYTIIIAPKDTANYKGGESFVMNVAEGNVVTFTGNDAAAPVKPGVISITGTQQLWNAKSITAAASNGNTATAAYNVTVDKAGRYGVTATADGCGDTHGILTVYKAEAVHIIPVVNDKVYDGEAVTVSNASDYPDGTYFAYTGGEIIGISYDAPKDAGKYTVTAHVPATDTTVAYAETSTFEITKKPISVTAISVTKQVYRTNPDLRAEYEGLVTGDSDIKDMLVLPSFALRTSDSENIDVNNVGNYTIVPSGVVSKNYEVTQYNNGNFAVQASDPASTMNIVGLPYGQVYYGDEFRVSVYGNVGQRVDGNGTYNNPSSVISWFVSDGSGDWTQNNGNVTIDNDGNVKIKGDKAADFTIRAERGTGDYKIYAEYDVTVAKRPVYISMKGEDSKVYNGSDQKVDVSKSVVSGALTDITLTSANLNPQTGKDVGEYIITASYSDDKYVGTGKGLMTITPKPAVVTSDDNLDNVYGTAPSIADNAYTVSGTCGSDQVITTVHTRSDVRFNNDVGNYEIFTAGVENKNYDVSYVSGKYEVVSETLTAKSGVDDKTVINTITNQVKRAYGVVNPQMGYDVKDMITGDSLADFAISSNFVVYNRVQEDNANVVGSASNESASTNAGEYVNGYGTSDNYGRIDLDDTFANVNANALNYTITPKDGVLDIYQSNVTIEVQNLTVKTGTTLSDSSYYAVVYRVLTEAPMNDTLADLRLHYTPLGIAGTANCVTGTDNINVTLESGSTELPPAISLSEYFAQNYYALNVSKGDLKVRDKAANAVITPDKDSVTVTTTIPTSEGGTEPVNVGDIDYVVIDKSGNKMAWGTMAVDPSKVGTYADDPYDTIKDSLTALPNGNYTILLDPTGIEYALEPTYKDFTVGGGNVTPTPGGGGGGGGVVTPPVLIKDDHFAYMQGDDNGNFRPDANLTRAEAATIFYNLLVDKSMGSSKTDFTDVKGNEWYATAVETLASRGILGGYEDGSFRPSNNITRAEFAAIASRFDDLSTGTVTFKDVTPDHWAYNYIVSAATKGWITGYEDNTFRPENNITRAEVVTLVNRVLDRVPDKDYIDKNIDDIKVLKDVTKAHWAYYNIIEATNGHDYTKDSKGNETWKKLK